MNKDKTIGVMTYHTLRYLHRDRTIQNEFYAVESANDIKKILWRRVKPYMLTSEDEAAFAKGAALNDFDAIFDWLCNERKWVYSKYVFATKVLQDVLKDIQTPPTAAAQRGEPNNYMAIEKDRAGAVGLTS